jgi:hypothetical protein
MPNFTAGTSFGANDTVTNTKLNALIADATINPECTLSINSGTIGTLSCTRGTIGTFNSTTGTVATLNTTTGSVQTLSAGTLATNLTGGTYSGLINSSTGTFSGSIGTARSLTAGTIANLSATTSTFLGEITGSTNVVNIGGGQLYKDASGNVGIGTTTGTVKLNIYGNTGAADGTWAGGSDLLALNNAGSFSEQAISFKEDGSNIGAKIGVKNTGNGAYDIIFANRATTSATSPITEKVRITNTGNVGIGTTSPSRQLTVSGGSAALGITSTAAGGNTISIDPATTASGGFAQIDCSGANALRFNTNSAERIRIDSSGGVTIAGLAGTGSRAVNASAAGLLSAASDASLKEEVVGAHIAGLDEILQIHPKMYRWKDDIANRGENASIELGFIANDVAPIIPSAAPLGRDGLYGFYDRSITAALVKAVQELKFENDSLKSRIEALEAK